MGKQSERKKARRRKRLASREAGRLPDWLFDDHPVEPDIRLVPRDVTEVVLGIGNSLDDEDPDKLVQLVRQAERFDQRITQRGWAFDSDFSSDGGFASWFYAPSGAELDDEDRETVTRIWFTVVDPDDADDEDFPNAVHVILVGSDETDTAHRLPPDRLFARIEAIESYRIGDPRPQLD